MPNEHSQPSILSLFHLVPQTSHKSPSHIHISLSCFITHLSSIRVIYMTMALGTYPLESHVLGKGYTTEESDTELPSPQNQQQYPYPQSKDLYNAPFSTFWNVDVYLCYNMLGVCDLLFDFYFTWGVRLRKMPRVSEETLKACARLRTGLLKLE